MNMRMRHFLKFRNSFHTASSVWRQLATCSVGIIWQCPGTSRPLQAVINFFRLLRSLFIQLPFIGELTTVLLSPVGGLWLQAAPW